MQTGGGFALSREVEDLIIADAALTIGFSIALSGGMSGVGSRAFLYLLPVSFVAVSLSFILHELMHKFVAQRFGSAAAFRRSDQGIIITLVTSLFGFLVGLPGATVIYSSHFTREQDAYVSLAGPLTNFLVFALFFVAGSALFPGFSHNLLDMISTISLSGNAYLQTVFAFTVFISIYLAFFNMLPLYPLDGSKVFRWNKPVYLVVMAVIFGLLFMITGLALIPALVFVLILALILSSFYRMMAF
jgi:Zn-dependent protease